MAAKKPIGYDKILLGVGGAVALGLITMVVLKAGGVEDAFETTSGTPKEAPEIPGEIPVAGAIASLKDAPKWEIGEKDGRKLDLLTGISWYLKSDGGEPIDILDDSNEQIHEGIKNIWWHDNNLDVAWSDAPERDPDVDGFTNREEYEGKTDPNDAQSFPPLIMKLELVKLESRPFKITFSSESGESYQFRYLDAYTGAQRKSRTDYIPAGDPADSIFYPDGPTGLRFRLLSVEEREVVNERTNTTSREKFAMIEDLLPAKAGDKFEVQKGKAGLIRRDYGLILMLNAAGSQGQEFKVDERASFALPADPNATDKPYTFKEVVDDTTVIISHQEGAETTLYKLVEGGEIEPYTP
jgi:hypothetical protein